MRRAETRLQKDSGGFSLIELSVSVAIALIVALVVTKFWIATSEGFSIDSNIVTVKGESERAIETMTERIQRAAAPSIALSNGNATIDFVDASDGSNVQYTLSPLAPAAPNWGQIIQTVNGTQGVIAGYVESLQFGTSATGLVTITARFHKGAGRPETALTVQSSVAARS